MVQKVTKLKERNGPLPIVLVDIGKEYKCIFFFIKDCCGLLIQAESLNKRADIVQYHRCQKFVHIQKNYHTRYKCMECRNDDSTHECIKPKTTPAKCASCEGCICPYPGCAKKNRTTHGRRETKIT